MAKRKKRKSKKSNTELLFWGAGAIALFGIFKAVSGGSNSGGSFWTGGGSGGGQTGGQTDSTGSPFVAQQWAESFQTYCIPACYIDCDYRYDILKQIQEKLSDAQIKQVSDVLKNSTSKNMYEHMAAMSWFGGPFTNNKAEALYARLQQMSL